MCKKNQIALLGFLGLLLTQSLFATTYYVDATNGNDNQSGLSPATAWQNLWKIRASNPQPSDTFLLKRGEHWAGNQMYITASGTFNQPIVYSSYGSGDLPIISAITPIVGSDMASNWTDTGGNIWTFSLNNSPGRLWLDGVEHLRASTLADLGTTDNENAFAYWFHQGGILSVYATQNPATAYNAIEGSQLTITAIVENAAHLVFEHIEFRGGSLASLQLFGADSIEIKNCQLGHSANSGLTLINLSSNPTDAATHINVHDNVFDSDFTFFYGLGSERGCGDGIKLFYGVNNCQVHNNTFRNWAHNAIELLGNNATATGVNENQFYDNYITAPNIPYAHPMGADGFLGKCQHNHFFRNLVEHCRTASQINGNDNHIHHNIIRYMRASPSKTSPTAHAFILGIYGTDLVCQNNRFDHNLIIDTDEAGFLVRGYGFTHAQVKDNFIRNNIIYQTGQAPYNNAYAIGTGLVINDVGDGVGSNTYQNNLFYNSNEVEDVLLEHLNTYYTAVGFNGTNGQEGNLVANNLKDDPLFTDLEADHYLPQNQSVAVNAGINIGLPIDYAQNPRLVGTAPDIGPLETNVGGTSSAHWSFRRVKNINDIKLKLVWKTYSETNTDLFTIERQEDGQSSWVPIAQVPAAGNSSDTIKYVYLDTLPPLGIVYYRLQLLGLDGQTSYSIIKTDTLSSSVNWSFLKTKVTNNNQKIKLTWKTKTEGHSDFFEVERQETSGIWTTLTQVAAAGFSTQGTKYTYKDDLPPIDQAIIYRIKLTGLDGGIFYSEQDTITINSGGTFKVNTTAHHILQLLSSKPFDNTNMQVEIIDIYGRLWYTAQNKRHWSIAALPSGIYFLRISYGEQVEVLKFFK